VGGADQLAVPARGRLAVRAEAADGGSLRRIQDLLTSRLTVTWQDLGGEASTTARSEDI
jgi:hypothetical protein